MKLRMERQQFVTENNELMEVRYKIEHISTFATLQHCICNLHFFPHHVFVCVGSYRIIFRGIILKLFLCQNLTFVTIPSLF